LARDMRLSDGTACQAIGVEALAHLSRETGIDLKAIEIAALKQSILPERYVRNRKMLSIENQVTLLESALCIVGLGGLGGLVCDTAARLGIGRLVLIDGDVFEDHNLNRQLLSRTDRLGVHKADAAAMHVEAINPAITVTAIATPLTSSNASRLIDASLNLVVDCLDTIHARFDLQTAARRVGVPMVSSAIAGMYGHVTTIFPEDTGLELVYGPEKARRSDRGVEGSLGCLAPAVNLIASLASAEVLKLLLGRGHLLRNRLLVADLNDSTFETLRLSTD
jgi:molybdopterin-synthase adenylyltransferase